MQSNLKRMNEFNINNMDLTQFCKVLECLELSYQLEKKMEKSKKSETSNKNSEKSNGKHSGKKHANSTNELSPVSAKQTLAEHAKKQKESKAKKAPTHNEINEMVVESIKIL